MSEQPGAGLAHDAEVLGEAADAVRTLLASLQSQIDALNQTVATQSDRIARLYAATERHACPGGSEVYDNDLQALKPANIGECIRGGLCHCEVGYILTAQTWSPTT